ncbi:hypothetical protein BV25DRAFT_166969 [Artomyces pyxidatus]|uniref:Uncharacterized protein n=1 Tax=Artomyces pyxidatus TaxID=48021 RepID=A0ACB8SI69_9AGAM|nr:hypothetical protein BV25DRAFT_166969 [Artomyces pyxidatus]
MVPYCEVQGGVPYEILRLAIPGEVHTWCLRGAQVAANLIASEQRAYARERRTKDDTIWRKAPGRSGENPPFLRYINVATTYSTEFHGEFPETPEPYVIPGHKALFVRLSSPKSSTDVRIDPERKKVSRIQTQPIETSALGKEAISSIHL